MEFILHLPLEINKDGPLWQTWDSFYRKCQLYQSTELHGASEGDSSSLLLFAGSHHINSICSSLKVYNLNLETLTKVLHIVEQVCLPYFILLFERFRYFSMKQDLSNNLDDNSVVLQKQAEICEFINVKDGTGTNVLCISQKTESQDQSFINAERRGYNKVDYNGGEKLHGSYRDNHPDRFDSLVKSVGPEMFDRSISSSSQDAELPTSVEFNSHSLSADSSLPHPEKFNTSSTDKKHFGGKLSGVLNKWKVGKNRKLNKSWKIKDVCFGKTDKRLAVRSLEKDGWNSEAAVDASNEVGEDTSAMSVPLTSTIVATENVNLKQFQCCQCSRDFAGRNCFKKHLLTKHKGCSEFVCRVCQATYADAENYWLHYTNTHTVEQKMRRARRGPAVRIKLEEDVRNFQCTICGKAFHKKGYLNKHINYNHKRSFLCWHCGEEFPNLADYKEHSEKHVINGRFVCDLCQKPYNNLFRLVGHLNNHLQPQNKCGICGLAFRRQKSLAKHVEKHTDVSAHMCKICGKYFVRQGILQCHMRTHSGEKRFTCELCGKTYAQKATLIRHKRWHTGEQPYECEICGKRTRSSGELNKHKRKHSDKFSCVCEICGKGFNYSSSLLEHRLGHSGKRSYACDMCGRTYIYREGLRAHLKSSRCTGRAEDGIKRTPRATKLSLSGVPDTKVDKPKVFRQVHQSTETGSKDVPDWHCMLRNNEPDGGTSVILVPSFY